MYPCPVALLNENFSRLESETHGSVYILLFTQWKYFAAIVVNFFFFSKGIDHFPPFFPLFRVYSFIARYILV